VETIKSFKKYFLVLTLSLLFISGDVFSPIVSNTFGYNLTSTTIVSAKGSHSSSSHSSGSVKSGSFSAPKSSSSGTKSGSFSNSTNSTSSTSNKSSTVNSNGSNTSSGSRWSFIPIPFFFGGGSGYGNPFIFIGSFFQFIILIIVVIVIIRVIKKSKRKK
jgi:hypothetical protein